MLEKAMLLPSFFTEVNAPAKAAAPRAVIAMVFRRPRTLILTRKAASTGPNIPAVEEIE